MHALLLQRMEAEGAGLLEDDDELAAAAEETAAALEAAMPALGLEPASDPAAAGAAEAAALAALEALPDGMVPVVDGLGLPAFAPIAPLLVARGAVGLIHHPTALETGLDAEALRVRECLLFPALPRLIATSRLTAERLVADFAVNPARIGVVEPGARAAVLDGGRVTR